MKTILEVAEYHKKYESWFDYQRISAGSKLLATAVKQDFEELLKINENEELDLEKNPADYDLFMWDMAVEEVVYSALTNAFKSMSILTPEQQETACDTIRYFLDGWGEVGGITFDGLDQDKELIGDDGLTKESKRYILSVATQIIENDIKDI